LLKGLDQVLAGQSHITGDHFTVADVAVGSILGYGILMLQLSYADYPNLAAYVQRISDRPAYKKAILGS
jgi:glutathione S-transferase